MFDFFMRHENGIRLFLLSFLVLYFELALIRFTSAEVIYLGYFSNFILISVFLGIGLGFLLSDRKVNLFRLTPQVILFLVAFILVTHIDVSTLRENIGQLFFGQRSTTLLKLPLWFCLALILSMTVLVFSGFAQETGRCFHSFRPIVAYSIDIGGSLAGILVFTLHAYFGTSPITWFSLSFILVIVLSYRYSMFNPIAMMIGVLILIYSASPNHYIEWSPYQRIDVWPIVHRGHPVGFNLAANGIGHQGMERVGTKEPIYDYAYSDIIKLRNGKNYKDTLIIGSGAGTDVSYAIHYGVKNIDAVEIDPVIMKAGKLFHPEKPYSDERVKVFINDGRAFMERASKKYDLVIFALPDSIATLSNFANIRLESFLFTIQAFRQVKKLLKDDGVFVLYNYYRKEWLFKKLSSMLENVFGHPPVYRIYADEKKGMLAALAIGPKIAGDGTHDALIVPATDDWPFLYMEKPHLPPMYILIMLMFIGCAVGGVFMSGHLKLRNLQFNGVFAFMGAAFLLLETKSIIQFFLLFGATWLVNALVFFAILVSVLIANLVVYKGDFKNPSPFFVILLISLIIQLLFPLNRLLLVEHTGARYVIASLIFFSPIFFANLVFGFLFKNTPKAASAFGWNIIGTTVGGSLEYLSIATGYQALTLLIVALYVICFIWSYWTVRGLKEVMVS